jgi:hypothetical protein
MRTLDLQLRIAVRYGHRSDHPCMAHVTWSNGISLVASDRLSIWDWAPDRVIVSISSTEDATC